ncbi:hypothetical protein [Leifsonia sp. PS1209]|uniref:hypothetical protein n=1 Tax=Leifsonia sp. PS1209 TaxID=2724914 RepID=UPI001442C604|nr:hypothetical protein [Leifsonia sp. PS1209]QIZ99259.1 hypothetical protein HF024_12570 [Leifsonia sp. PS1209]
MGAARQLAVSAWRADDTRMRAAAWIASAAALLGIGLTWSALRVIGLYALWTVGMDEGLLFTAEFGTRAVLLGATVVCVVLGVARRGRDGSGRDGSGRGALVTAIVLAVLIVAAQVQQVAVAVHFAWSALFSVTTLTWLGFAALTIAACVLALTARRPVAVRGVRVPSSTVTGSMDAVGAADAGNAGAAARFVWFSVGAAFVAFVASILVVAQALIVPNAWGPALVALVHAWVTVIAVAVQVIAALFVVRGSALGRLVVSAVAVVLLNDLTETSMLGMWPDGSDADAGVSGAGILVATIAAVAAAVALWLPPVSRWLAGAGAGAVGDGRVGEPARSVV